MLKRWRVEWRRSKWLLLSPTLLLHLNFHSLPSSSQSEVKVRHCLIHTYKTTRSPTLTPDFSPTISEHSNGWSTSLSGDTQIWSEQDENQSRPPCRRRWKTHRFRLISNSLFLAQPPSTTANYWDDVCKIWPACPHKWQQIWTIYASGIRKQEANEVIKWQRVSIRLQHSRPRADQIWLLSFFPSLFADKSTHKAEAPESFQQCQKNLKMTFAQSFSRNILSGKLSAGYKWHI